MMADNMREMIHLKKLAAIVNGVHDSNADAYRAKLQAKMDTITDYAYVNSLRMEDFKNLDELYDKMRSINSKEELEKLIERTPEVQKENFRLLWERLPTHA